jgi:hypothetical protein
VLLKHFFSCTTVTIQNIYTYHCYNTKHVCALLFTANIDAIFRILVVQDNLLVGRFEVFRPGSQQNNNPVEASNFAVAAFLIECN